MKSPAGRGLPGRTHPRRAPSALDAATFGLVLEWLLPVLLMLVGAGAIGLHVIRLRQWAESRELEFEQVAGRARALATEPEDGAQREAPR